MRRDDDPHRGRVRIDSVGKDVVHEVGGLALGRVPGERGPQEPAAEEGAEPIDSERAATEAPAAAEAPSEQPAEIDDADPATAPVVRKRKRSSHEDRFAVKDAPAAEPVHDAEDETTQSPHDEDSRPAP